MLNIVFILQESERGNEMDTLTRPWASKRNARESISQ